MFVSATLRIVRNSIRLKLKSFCYSVAWSKYNQKYFVENVHKDKLNIATFLTFIHKESVGYSISFIQRGPIPQLILFTFVFPDLLPKVSLFTNCNKSLNSHFTSQGSFDNLSKPINWQAQSDNDAIASVTNAGSSRFYQSWTLYLLTVEVSIHFTIKIFKD